MPLLGTNQRYAGAPGLIRATSAIWGIAAIIAHNTYISGNLGIGTTAPAGTLDIGQAVTAASAGTYYTTKLNNSYTGTMASATPVTSVYGLYNRPNIGIGGTSPQLTNLFVNYTSGNIGIGTTSVVTNLYLNYVAAPTLNGGSSVTNTYAFVSEAGAGNVGIGTTGPVNKLHVYGTSATSSTSANNGILTVGSDSTVQLSVGIEPVSPCNPCTPCIPCWPVAPSAPAGPETP